MHTLDRPMLQPPTLQLQVKMELQHAVVPDGAGDPPQLCGLRHVQRRTRRPWSLQEEAMVLCHLPIRPWLPGQMGQKKLLLHQQ